MAVVCGTMSIAVPILHDSESGYDGNMSIDSSDMGSDSSSAWPRDSHIGLKYQSTSMHVRLCQNLCERRRLGPSQVRLGVGFLFRS